MQKYWPISRQGALRKDANLLSAKALIFITEIYHMTFRELENGQCKNFLKKGK